LGCVFNREVWAILLAKLHLHDVVLVREEDVMDWWLHNRKIVAKHVRRGFDSLFFLVGWRLWKERNSRISRTFLRPATDATTLAVSIMAEAEEWCVAGYKQLLSLLALL
jgi:hypothetical protein